jgi:hypothetical protein
VQTLDFRLIPKAKKINQMKNLLFLLVFVLVLAPGCKKDFLDLAPADTISNVQLAENPAAVQAIINGIYANLRTYAIGGNTGHIDYGLRGVMAGLDMMSNDITMARFHWYGFFYNYSGRVQDASRTRILWNTYYKQVAEANSVINAIDPTTTDPAAKALLGQALALRAFFTFNTARIYAHTYLGHESDLCIPMPTGLSFEGKPRSTVREVYAQVKTDAEAAVDLLADFNRSTKQEVNQAVAQAFLARVYLEMGEWNDAAEMAAAARAGMVPMGPAEYANGFSDIGQSECMWGADIDAESSTVFASFFSHFDNTKGGYAGALGVYKQIDADLYSKISESDIRRALFVHPDSLNEGIPPYSNLKFRDPTFFEGDYIYLRSSEMWLIEAEAKARAGDANAAQVLFDLVSTRDPNYELSSATGNDLVEEIYLQRRIELWGEGHSWYDLKRLKKPLVRDYPGTNHASFGLFNYPAEDNKFRFQIPLDELNANDAISTAEQNPN